MEPCDRDNLDQWLDGALRDYGQAAPMPGLEARILKQLSEPRPGAPGKLWWMVSAATAGIAGLFMALWAVHPSHPNRPAGPAVSHLSQAESGVRTQPSRPISEPSPASPPGKSLRQRMLEVKTRSHLKPEQFPSFRPLSPQEQMLKRYAREFPDEAASLAREQAQLETEGENWFRQSTRENRSQEER